MSIYAKVIADSITENGARLTTMEIQGQRFILSEINTHRRFSRNSASSRAIPFEKQLKRMKELGIAYPVSWPREQKGMQGGEEFDPAKIELFRNSWTIAAENAIQHATDLHNAGVHKSVVNRLLEPFMWHKIIISATEWQNFFDQRCSPLAQPEIRALAEKMRDALQSSTPQHVGRADYHLPYIDEDTVQAVINDPAISDTRRALRMISAARCARVSYLTHDGKRDISADLDLFTKLASARPPHWSPMEHVALPDLENLHRSNFDGWTQLRWLYERGIFR